MLIQMEKRILMVWKIGQMNQMIGEIYRDASMRIILRSSIDEGAPAYEFRKIDYSKVTVE
ncbi:MAG: hypothetical protein J1E62_00690 [Lachnospiraceae bacterium]|nr:hypothetical protein [Lachnospiraceae bacterium]